MLKNKLTLSRSALLAKPESRWRQLRDTSGQLRTDKRLWISLCGLCLIFGFWISAFTQQEFKYDSKGKRNPFTPLVTADGRLLKLDQVETEQTVSLEGIIYDKNGLSYAVVNGEVVMIGDRIGDSQVLKIEPNKVTFIKEGQALEMELRKEEEE